MNTLDIQAGQKNFVSASEEAKLQFLDRFVKQTIAVYQAGQLSSQALFELHHEFGHDFQLNTIQGHGLRKPFGYAGDFIMIDKIYTRYSSKIPRYRIWDEYFHRQAAPQAVRNRKGYFKKLVRKTLNEKKLVSLLNVGSGPGRDLAELYDSLSQPQRLHSTSVDMDKRAIAYAQELNKLYTRYTRFENRNILRFQCEQNFNMIWSAGLFDYFNDKVFVSVLRRFSNNLKPGGEIVIGNFNEDCNPSRAYMEVFGEWFLHHRSEQQLIDLAQKAGYRTNEISVGREPENVNLFLHIKPVHSK